METLFERGLVLPAQAVKKRNIQELSRHSVGLGGVPSDLPGVTDDLGYQIREFSYGDILPRANVDDGSWRTED